MNPLASAQRSHARVGMVLTEPTCGRRDLEAALAHAHQLVYLINVALTWEIERHRLVPSVPSDSTVALALEGKAR